MHYVTILSILLRRWWLLVAFGIIGVVAGLLWNASIPRRYESSLTLQLNPAARSALLPYFNDGVSRSPNDFVTLAASYAELLRSRSFGQLAIDRLQLQTTPEAVARAISARLITNTNILRLTVSWDNPGEARQLAQGVADVFIKENLRLQQTEAGVQSRLQEMEDLEQTYRANVEVLRKQRDQRYADIGAGDISKLGELNNIESRLTALESANANLLIESNRTRATYNTATILDNATQAVAVGPARSQSVVVGLLIGLGLAIAAALLMEQLDTRLRTPESIAALVEGSPLATIGRINTRRWPAAAKAGHLVTLHQARGAGAEAFRTLRTNLRFAAPNERMRSLLITSAGPSEGKTFVASNLAIAFAQAGRRVLLVDADLRRPSLHKVFGIDNEQGLMSILMEAIEAGTQSKAEDVRSDDHDQAAANLAGVCTSEVENLWLLPSGKVPQNPSIILGSEALAQVMARLQERWDLVILDSAPLGPVADSLLIAAHADAALLVARAEQTRRAALEHVLETLRQTGNSVLGVVLNDLRLGFIDRYTYGGYYTYGKHYYGQPDGAADETQNGHTRPPTPVVPGNTGSARLG